MASPSENKCYGSKPKQINDTHHEKTDLKVFVSPPAHQSFYGYDNDKDLKVCFLVTHVKWFCPKINLIK